MHHEIRYKCFFKSPQFFQSTYLDCLEKFTLYVILSMDVNVTTLYIS